MGMATFTEEELDNGSAGLIEGDELCKLCEMRKSKHADNLACLFSPTTYEAMTPDYYWVWSEQIPLGG